MPIAQVFFPPELAHQPEFDTMESVGVGNQTDFLRHLFFQRMRQTGRDDRLDKELVRLVLEHAKGVVSHPSRPTVIRQETFLRQPFGELALEETIEETPFLKSAGPEDFLVEIQEEKPFSCVAILDCSSSMSGDKHLLASIAVAVLLLEVPPRDASLIVFASDASTIKGLGTEEAAEETVLRFMRSQPRGFTNIARGLEEGLKQLRGAKGKRRKVGLIATDGRTTEGADPIEAARKFDFLVVLHLHGPGSHLEASREMAHHGRGICLEVEQFEELPRRLYDALRMLSRM